jgi:hypothetical protein
MALTFSTGKTRQDSEVRFWAGFAVVLALFAQILFPPQVMAMPSSHGMQMVLCSSGMDSQPIVDKLIVKSTPKKSGLAGLKCAQCVLASISAITTATPVFQPAIYSEIHTGFIPITERTPIKARAPPRPHSCGPPSQA